MMTGIDGPIEIAITEREREKKSREFFINYTLAVNTLFHLVAFSTGIGISGIKHGTWFT